MREKKDINIEIGGNIQVAREQAGYTQDTLSEMLGMTPNHLSAIERGASGISLEALQRLCRLLGVSADRIIFGTDEPEAEALALARRISDIKPEYRQQVQEPTPKTGIDRGFWFVFRAFKQVPKSTLILALLLELCVEYNHTGRSFLVALRLAITGFFDP